MLLSTLLPLLPFILARAQAQQQPHPFQLNEERDVQLDERGLPITATTTMWHMVTMTETVWVQPTDQAVFAPTPPVLTAGHSSSHSASTTVTHSSEPSAHTSSHSTTHPSETSSAHSSTEQSVVVESATASPSASHTSHSASHSVSPTASPTVSTTQSYVPYSRSSGSGEAQVALSSSHSSSSAAASSHPSTHTESSLTAEAPSSTATVRATSSASNASHSPSETHSSSYHSPSTTSHSSTTSRSSSASPSSSSISSSSLASSSHSSTHTESSLTVEAVTSTHTSTTSSSHSPTSTASPSPSASSGLPPVPSRIMAGYYPDWSSWYLAPENVDFSKFDILDFAFAIPTESGGLEFTQYDSSDLLHRLVKVAHAHGKRVKLSIGGWTGSKYFSPIAADAGLRKVFVKSMTDAYSTYNLDGIDIDWEYPGAGGAAGNIVTPQDSANYLLMLQDLRAALPSGALITLATQVWPFTGSNGSPLSNVRGFAAVIDWILIMNYDIWGSSSTPGPNAPLSDACGNSTQPLANAYASVSSWTQAGLDPSQITIGVPAYGYLQQSWATSLRQRDVPEPANSTMWPMRERRGMENRFTTVSSGWSTTEGQVMWHDLVSQGALQKQWDGQWVGAGGFSRVWDECSSTPFLKSTQSGQIVTYDDPQSMSLKGQFAAQAGLRGCNVFSVDGDLTNGEWPLTDAVRSGLGL